MTGRSIDNREAFAFLDSYPDYGFTAHPSLDESFGAGFTTRLQSALLAMQAPELLAAFPRSGFIAADDSDFTPIHALALELGFIRDR